MYSITSSLQGANSSGSLDPLHRIAPVTFMDADYIDSPSRPLAEIEFRYRSKEALKYLSIIPRTPSPEPFKEDLSEEKVQKIYVSVLHYILSRRKLTEHRSSSTRRPSLVSATTPVTNMTTKTWRW